LTTSSSTSKIFDNLDEITLNNITLDDVVFESQGQAESYGVEDPRVAFR